MVVHTVHTAHLGSISHTEVERPQTPSVKQFLIHETASRGRHLVNQKLFHSLIQDANDFLEFLIWLLFHFLPAAQASRSITRYSSRSPP